LLLDGHHGRLGHRSVLQAGEPGTPSKEKGTVGHQCSAAALAPDTPGTGATPPPGGRKQLPPSTVSFQCQFSKIVAQYQQLALR